MRTCPVPAGAAADPGRTDLPDGRPRRARRPPPDQEDRRRTHDRRRHPPAREHPSADRVLVVDEGRVVEHGRYEELVDAGALFAELVALANGR
ncbi:ABC transporter family carbohydrate exporter [Streptomyces viridosporus ATCC 14672]|uniref:ABC transporter family carbohydrate exporter n=1 Tax=Streptomyces viridosporus (strain ATCC 14672 / DSM 40746 / JCM 4963 / KCTC 9882 / NRRL B-12104 / FH 1290) TaxID=566461 RepID=D5ZYB3_STRV1|nr:ABC transporter family carbohydrate exporter [Streptomyces viridosporus ATCC 14672]